MRKAQRSVKNRRQTPMSLNRTRANQLKKLRQSNLRNTKYECHACVCVRTRACLIRFNDSIKSVQNTQRSFIHIDEFFKFQSTGLVRAFQMSVDRARHGFPTFSREGSLRLFNFQLTESVRALQRSVIDNLTTGFVMAFRLSVDRARHGSSIHKNYVFDREQLLRLDLVTAFHSFSNVSHQGSSRLLKFQSTGLVKYSFSNVSRQGLSRLLKSSNRQIFLNVSRQGSSRLGKFQQTGLVKAFQKKSVARAR